ncbi:MAG: DUF368 domain-containing protein [Alkalibacterium gilvum]|uniref:Putative membrane protein n=1 Tax=Alkalibacterium gilvum TaxID=1130080 RepID=A0A1H6T174_9LACT|nr:MULTISPECIES: DUF368 domain-containing protein [Alkalibacterium]MDN6193841.1 DUF368 domain-containing protein [Alkalibacterium sp.]MDN6294658.1 DUF368 domain-containing protein [Alkalibacterium sp.]MDN6295810.1 DUF368 domain-containing protein [Alkalibacterium sp.]MDN6730165.1 DUF368 domain-containing protein [Alkalibacterium sp.]SEI73843.1 putative membrane protein [Alkalibacterium gilvum]
MKKHKESSRSQLIDWLLRVLKGTLIGSGAILPGVSGGALAAVFGLYKPLILFISDITNQFMKGIKFFLPVGIGAVLGVFVLAYPLNYGLDYYPVHILWAFIGTIIGTLPTLYREAGKNGRKAHHIYLAVISSVVMFILLLWANKNLDLQVEQNSVTWLLSGAIFASGFIVPGLSPSNFLIYLNLYQPLTKAIRVLDFSVLIPVAVGAIICIFLFAKAIQYLLDIAYATVFHFVFGVVVASTIIIAPSADMYNGLSVLDYGVVILLFFLGLALGFWMGRLEDTYKKD